MENNVIDWLPQLPETKTFRAATETINQAIHEDLLRKNESYAHLFFTLAERIKRKVDFCLKETGQDGEQFPDRWYRLRHATILEGNMRETIVLPTKYHCDEMHIARVIDELEADDQRIALAIYLVRTRLIRTATARLKDYQGFAKTLNAVLEDPSSEEPLPETDDSIIQQAYNDRFFTFARMKDTKLLYDSMLGKRTREYVAYKNQRN